MSPRALRHRSVSPLVALVALALCACAGPRNFDNENDTLRRELLEARAEIDRLKASEDRLAGALEAERNAAARRPPSEQALALLPRAQTLVIGRLSGLSAQRDAVDLYLTPLDDRGRFVQVAGTLTLRIDFIPPAQSASPVEPRLLASLTLSPTELREAYRSGITGTHYSVRVPLDHAPDGAGGSLSASARLDDLVAGDRLEANAQWPLAEPRP